MLDFLQRLFGQPSSSIPRRQFRRGKRGGHKWSRPSTQGPFRPSSFRKGRSRTAARVAGKWKNGGWFQHRSAEDRTRHPSARRGEIVAWHGTPTLQNVKSIAAHGWVVGNGNALGDGVYASSDFSVAKGYAGSGGYVLKLAVKAGKVAVWSTGLQAAFNKWCTRQQCAADMSAKTAFLLNQGFHTLRDGNVIVVLLRAYRNPLAAKIKARRVRVISAIAAADGKEIDIRSLAQSR